MSNYYAVKKGINPGIYLTWKECEENVKGFSSAKYKKFLSKEEAEEYLKEDIKKNLKEIKEDNNLKDNNLKDNNLEDNNLEDNNLEDNNIEDDDFEEKRIVNEEYNFSECINIYTDGSCINNGKDNAVGGFGVYFEGEYKKSISKKVKSKEGYKITNNRAELKAILSGLEKLEREIKEEKEIVIHTDSMYSIQVLTNKKTFERIKKGKEVPNKDYVKKGYKLIRENANIKFHHVSAHTGKKDNHSIGNEKADKLANEAIKEEIGKIIFTFGKYKGENFMEVYKKDSKYLNWCMENSKNQIHDIKLFMDTYLNLYTQIKK